MTNLDRSKCAIQIGSIKKGKHTNRGVLAMRDRPRDLIGPDVSVSRCPKTPETVLCDAKPPWKDRLQVDGQLKREDQARS